MSLLLLFDVPAAPSNTKAIVDNANTTVIHVGGGVYQVEKTSGGGAAFDASAVSSSGMAGDFVLRIEITAVTGFLIVGVNSDPLTDNDYASIDYGFNEAGNVYQSGLPTGATSGWTLGDILWIGRTGTTLSYKIGADYATATVVQTVSSVSATLYFDSSFYTTGTKLKASFYVAMPSLAAAVGSYTLTGSPVGLMAQRRQVEAVGSYSITGTATGLKGGRKVAGNVGSYSLTGSALQFIPARKLVAAPGSYAVSGQTVALRIARKLTLVPGAYAYTGTATGLKKGYILTAAVGSYALTGTATALRTARKLAEAVGSYALTGTATALRIARKLAEAPGSYGLTGNAVTLTYGATSASYVLAAAVGSYSLNGVSALLGASRRLAGASGAYSLSGLSAGLVRAGHLGFAGGAYALGGNAVGLRVGRRLNTEIGLYRIFGTAPDLIYAPSFIPDGHPSLVHLSISPPPPLATLTLSSAPLAGAFVESEPPPQLEWSE